jgi:Sec-independent protein secretion pathway component TatC
MISLISMELPMLIVVGDRSAVSASSYVAELAILPRSGLLGLAAIIAPPDVLVMGGRTLFLFFRGLQYCVM